jgi:sulfonate transport system substrate-binding protein
MSAPTTSRPGARTILAAFTLLVAAIVATATLPDRAAQAGTAASGPETPPKVIRFGGPGAYKANQKMWGLLEVARVKGFLDREFANDGTRIEYTGFTTVPMVGEALASGAVDFAGQGELIAILSRAAGTDTRMILPMSRLENAYLIVPNNSPIKRVEDLRGKRIAYMRGAYIHIQTLRILADHGMSERDIVPVNLDPASSATVLASGGIDGVFVGAQLALPMRDRGIGRIAYHTRSAPTETAQTGLIVTADFARRHPATTQRVVSALVRAAKWAEDPANRDELTSLWVYGTERSVKDMREDIGAGPLTGRTSPLIDPFVVGQYRNTQAFAVQAKLLRAPVDLDQWIDRSFLNTALRQEGLTSFWPAFDAQGRAVGSGVQP